MRSICYIILTLLLCGCKISEVQSPVLKQSTWRVKFDAIAQRKEQDIYSLSQSDDSRDHYDLSYYIDAFATMHKVTREDKYLQSYFELVENVIEQAKPSYTFPKSQFKDNYLGWVDKSSPILKNHGGEFPLYESYCWRYVTDMLLFLHRNQDILDKGNNRTRYESILNFTKKNIFEKWFSRGDKHLYRSNTHMFSHWARIALDLHLISNERQYAIVYEEFNKRMITKLNFTAGNTKMLVPFTSFWNRKNNVIVDTNHANATIATIIKMYEESVGYDKETIEGMITLFDKVIWKDNANYARYIDGSGKGTGFFSDGWIKLGRYDKNLHKRVETHNRGRSIQFYANLCYNAQFH